MFFIALWLYRISEGLQGDILDLFSYMIERCIFAPRHRIAIDMIYGKIDIGELQSDRASPSMFDYPQRAEYCGLAIMARRPG